MEASVKPLTNGTGIYFFHIPKTAGVSLWYFLEQIFPFEKICPWWVWDQLILVPRQDLGRWSVFRGHFLNHLEPYIDRKLATFTMLRNPVERSISHYYHVRRDPDHPSHKYAIQMSLAEFCVDPLTRHMVENYQAAYLATSPRDTAAAACTLSVERLAQYELQQQMEYPDRYDDAALLERAKQRLDGFVAVGFTEDFTSSLSRIGRSLNCLGEPQPFAARNVNPERPRMTQVDRATLNLIRGLTEVDQRLSQFARSRFHHEAAVSWPQASPAGRSLISAGRVIGSTTR